MPATNVRLLALVEEACSPGETDRHPSVEASACGPKPSAEGSGGRVGSLVTAKSAIAGC
jgi:hypothetical protein